MSSVRVSDPASELSVATQQHARAWQSVWDLPAVLTPVVLTPGVMTPVVLTPSAIRTAFAGTLWSAAQGVQLRLQDRIPRLIDQDR